MGTGRPHSRPISTFRPVYVWHFGSEWRVVGETGRGGEARRTIVVGAMVGNVQHGAVGGGAGASRQRTLKTETEIEPWGQSGSPPETNVPKRVRPTPKIQSQRPSAPRDQITEPPQRHDGEQLRRIPRVSSTRSRTWCMGSP
jgi:hypothetical protein